MSNSFTKEERRLYLIFLLMGIFSFLLGKSLEMLLEPANILLKEIFYPLVLFLVGSALFATTLYAFKERSFIFALKAFVGSFVSSYLIFPLGVDFGAIIGGFLSSFLLMSSLYENFILMGLIDSAFMYLVGPLLVLWIMLITGLEAFKEQALINFTIKAFVIFNAPVFLGAGTLLMLNRMGVLLI